MDSAIRNARIDEASNAYNKTRDALLFLKQTKASAVPKARAICYWSRKHIPTACLRCLFFGAGGNFSHSPEHIQNPGQGIFTTGNFTLPGAANGRAGLPVAAV